ncbi:PREDICTED: alcohol dehydrogenase-like 1 [Ipomoea nil]|uniref:alcohol dehydrogenase-like 1 n=2 Tax=Ipomoea nil TaxID=35883 RepID=UPI000900A9AD|nr:PREDICTED: alcohol dehydrogenase-like 1 [Ipomoea nil]XP_019190373.1 PREDICTED: alcohol dehydrogenase-like 1 [Ipomoea nil]XP_019195623.1 PREDICTED: alcohol dehydrogenase-like 1 [Ipomoea nil]
MESNNSASETIGKPIKCKGAVCRGPGEALVIEEIEVDPPKAWEVRVKILCTSLCHTDCTLWKLDLGPASLFPRILGHEAAGVVESVGENVDEVKVGDMVIPVCRRNCGECKDCKLGRNSVCTKFPVEHYGGMPRDGTTRFRDKDGKGIYHHLWVSSFSEYTVVDISHIVKITPDLPVDKACLLSCCIPTGVGAAWKTAKIEKGSTVAIFGLGAVGLAVAEGARLRGASKIIGVDLNPDKFELGKKFGLTDFINPKAIGESSVPEAIKKMTDGGVDYSFECIGLASLMEDAFASSRQGGYTIILGVEMHGKPISVNPYELLAEKTIIGCNFGGINAKTDIPELAEKYLKNELNLEGFKTHEVKFEDIMQAFELLEQKKSLRCIIWMDNNNA